MRELSLFSGAGGGLLGTHLLGWRPVGYVEFNDYCQRVIRQRIIDGILPNAPIFGDIRAFVSEGYAASYQGMVDVITGGFPCQPFSNAGKQLGADDPRNMWPATIECLRIIRPRYALLENVPGLVTSGYFGTIMGDLAQGGFDCRWRILSAAELGAPHQRDRLWIVACTNQERWRWRSWEGQKQDGWGQSENCCKNVPHTDHARLEERERCTEARWARTTIDGRDWWAVEPELGRVATGVAHRVDRLKAIGNGQVPAVVAAAWHLLIDGVP